MRVPSFARLVFNKYFFQKIFAIAFLVLMVYILKQFIPLFLLIFLFAYLFLNLGEFLHDFLTKHIVSKMESKKFLKVFKFLFATNTIVLFLYLLFVGLIVFAISDLLPKIIQELTDLPKSLPFLSNQVKDVLNKLEEIKNFKQDIKGTLDTLLTESNYDILLKFIANIKSVGMIMIEFVVALILSFVFIIDRVKIQEYLKEVKKGNFAFLYNEYAVIFGKISNGFGLIFKAQSLISMVNTVLTVIGLYFIAFVHGATTFPYIFTLAIIVFILGMIPVLGMILSAIPMIMIGFSFGGPDSGLAVIVEILLMVTIIHMIEAYYLNPRIVSSYAELPISLTFLILVLSEQFVGFAGLLIGVPIFYIIIDVMKDFDVYITKVRKAYAGIHIVKSETKKSLDSDIRLSRSGKRSVNMSDDDL